MYNQGFFTIHNKAMISVDFLFDFDNMLGSGSGTIENIKKKILLMGQCEGLPTDDVKTNISNLCKDIEKMCVAILSLLITDLDLDAVSCLICACCPKIINSGKYHQTQKKFIALT